MAALRDRSGALWFATTTGLSRLTPEREEAVAAPPILIGGLRIAGIVHPLSALGQASVPHFELQPRQNNVQIDFFGMGFQSGEGLRYEYRLEGTGGEWSIPGLQRIVNYANLSPGSYNLRRTRRHHRRDGGVSPRRILHHPAADLAPMVSFSVDCDRDGLSGGRRRAVPVRANQVAARERQSFSHARGNRLRRDHHDR
jgi:hypothetical protein